MPHLKAYDKNGRVLAIGYDIEGEQGAVIIPNLAPHTNYPQGEFYVAWEGEKYESEKVVVPEFTTHNSSYKEVTFYFKDHLLVNAKSAYDIAVDTGFTGTQEEWVSTIKGDKGEPGKQGLPGKDGKSLSFEDLSAEQLSLLEGKQGEPGADGIDGKSSYELAVEEGFQGELGEYLDSLHGEKGEPLKFSDLTEEQIQSLKGQDGTMTFENLTEEQKASLKGEPGEPGLPGRDGVDGKDGTSTSPQDVIDIIKPDFDNRLDYIKDLVGKVHGTSISNYPKEQGEESDNNRILRAIQDVPINGTLYFPSTEEPINLDNTITITKNINLKSDAKIVYKGMRDKPAIVFKGQQYTSIDIRGIYDIDSYPVYGGINSYHGWESNNYIGIVFNNLKNVKINIGELIGFTVGQKHMVSEGKGHWFNTASVDFHINNKTSIELNSDGENSWMNSNKFSNSAFSYSGSPFINTTENLYCVKQTLTNGNTYGGNSNTFENFKFETRNPSSPNWTMIYLSKAVGFVFRNYRFEFNSQATFAEIDLSSQDSSQSYVTHSRDNLFYPEFILGTGHNIKFTNIGDIRLPRSSVAKIIEPSSKSYTLYNYDDLSKNYRYIGSNYHTIKGIYRKPIASTKWNEEVTYDYSTLESLIDSKGLTTFTSSYPMVIYLRNLTEGDEFSINKLSFQGSSSGIFIKCFDDSNTIIGKTDSNTNSLAMYGLYSEANNVWTFNNSKNSSFTINSPNVKKVAILISGTMNGVNIVTHDALNAIAKGSSNMANNKKNAFFSHIIPTSNRDFMYEDIVYNTNTTVGQSYGWKLVNGTWTSIGTIS